MARFGVVLDACVLLPIASCDALLTFADGEFYQPLWNSKIIEELKDAMLLVVPQREVPQASRRIAHMQRAFPGATVTGWEELEGAIECPDLNDRHVIATAIAGRAELIVTQNLKDFPSSALEVYGLTAISVDEFLLDLCDLDRGRTMQLFHDKVARFESPPMSLGNYCDYLHAYAPMFAELLRATQAKS